MIDRLIEYLNPEKGLQRQKARQKLELMKRSHDGASVSSRMKDWLPLQPGPGGALSPGSLDLMAGRVAFLYENSPPVKRGINAIANYTFGAGCVPHAVREDGKKHDRLEGLLKDFCDSPACDPEERETLYSKQLQAGIHVPRDGAFLLQRVWTRDKHCPLPFKIRCLSQDYIDKGRNQKGNYGACVIQGIEFNSLGERTGIWIREEPGNSPLTGGQASRRYDMRDFCHPFRTTVAGQIHGVTWAAPIIVRAKDFDDYMDAQLMRQKISSAFVGLIHDIEGGMSDGDTRPMEGKISPGTWMMAPEGKTVEFSNPPQPEGLSDYVRIQHHGIASGLEVPYMIVSSDFSDSNYTQSRMTLLDFSRQIESYRHHIFFPQLCWKIGSWIMEAAQLRGIGGRKAEILWVWPRRDFIDPEKDINAYILAVSNGFMSWEMAVREMGHDPEDVSRSIRASEQSLKDAGVRREQETRTPTEKEDA